MTEPRTSPFSFRDLPEGTVTFLFSDIEGSTQLLYRLRDQFTAVVGEHHRICAKRWRTGADMSCARRGTRSS